MEYKEYVKRFQGKHYTSATKRDVVWMRIIKVKQNPKDFYTYLIICEYIRYELFRGMFSTCVKDVRCRKLIAPNDIGWDRISQSEYKKAKKEAFSKIYIPWN